MQRPSEAPQIPPPTARLLVNVYEKGTNKLLVTFSQNVSSEGENKWEELNIGLTAKEAVQVEITCENTSNISVFFDDLSVKVQAVPTVIVLQENHYYPFGLGMKGLDWVLPSGKEDKYTYNGKEKQTDFDLGWSDYGARQYDPQIGRMTSCDPLADKFSPLTPFNYGLNNPLLFVDPTGMEAKSVWEMVQNAWDNTEDGENKHFAGGQGSGLSFALFTLEGKPFAASATEPESLVAVTHKDAKGQGGIPGMDFLKDGSGGYMTLQDVFRMGDRAFNEDSYSEAGYQAVAWTIANHSRAMGQTITQMFSGPLTNRRLDLNAHERKNSTQRGLYQKFESIMSAVFHAILQIGADPTNEATHWSGTDFLENGSNYHKAQHGGIYIEQEHYNAALAIGVGTLPGLYLGANGSLAKNDKYNPLGVVRYHTTAFISHTMFFKNY